MELITIKTQAFELYFNFVKKYNVTILKFNGIFRLTSISSPLNLPAHVLRIKKTMVHKEMKFISCLLTFHKNCSLVKEYIK